MIGERTFDEVAHHAADHHLGIAMCKEGVRKEIHCSDACLDPGRLRGVARRRLPDTPLTASMSFYRPKKTGDSKVPGRSLKSGTRFTLTASCRCNRRTRCCAHCRPADTPLSSAQAYRC